MVTHLKMEELQLSPLMGYANLFLGRLLGRLSIVQVYISLVYKGEWRMVLFGSPFSFSLGFLNWILFKIVFKTKLEL